MAYRDDTAAAAARLAALESDLGRRRATADALAGYRARLHQELMRLEHALAWYRHGERHGWPRSRKLGEDLSPAAPPTLLLTSPAALELRARTLDPTAIARRLVDVETELSDGDWRGRRLRWEVDELRARCQMLRQDVEGYAWLYPEHPPPPMRDDATALAVAVTAVLGGFWAALLMLAALVGAG